MGFARKEAQGQGPYGHWKTMTFLAALRHDRIDVPWVDTANKLVWAGAVANETMRIRPVAPIVVVLDAKVETVVGDLLVPKGTRVAVLMRPAACHPFRRKLRRA